MSTTQQPLALSALLDSRCTASHVPCEDDVAAIRHAARLLHRAGRAGEEYADAALEREREFPTGLPTVPVGVALPHADRAVREPGIALLTLREPVTFREMGNPDRPVPVAVVIMLALAAGDAHVEAIGLLAELIQRPGFLEEVIAARTDDELYRIFQSWTDPARRKEES